MLTFIVSENGSIPNNSSMYESGYEITARKDILIKPFSTFVINSGLILKCNSYDFIYLAIDDHYLNILKIENNIIENNTNIPYDIRIINLTNDNITIEKNNKICHFYCLNKAYLHETIVKNNKSKSEDIKPENVHEVQEVPEVPEVVETVQDNLSHGENNVELSQNQINANLAKRKYIRKKKMTINIP